MKAFAFGLGLNDEALTFSLFALAVVGDTGAGLAVAVVAVAGVAFPFTLALAPFTLEAPEVVDAGLPLPLNGGID